MLPLIAVSSLLVHITLSIIISFQANKSFKRTSDGAYKTFSISFLLFALHTSLYLFIIFLNTYGEVSDILLKTSIIASRCILYLGILYFIQTPIFQQNLFIKRYNFVITVITLLIIFVFSVFYYFSISSPYIDPRGVIVENINNVSLQLLMAAFPLFTAIGWAYFLIQIITKTVPSTFFKYKIYFLCLGILGAAIGNTIYIFANNGTVSLWGVSIVLLGYLMVAAAISMSEIRRLFLKPVI